MNDTLVFYLDFDGVVVTDRYRDMMGQALNPYLVADVVALAQLAGAKVVIASTWRLDADCRHHLVQAGFPLSLLHPDWCTPRDGGRDVDFATGDVLPAHDLTRGQEIDLHIRRNGVTRYVIFDDDPAMLDHQRPWHVAPDPKKGLGPADLVRARALVARLTAHALAA